MLRLVRVGANVASVGLSRRGFEVPTIVGSRVQGTNDGWFKGSRYQRRLVQRFKVPTTVGSEVQGFKGASTQKSDDD